MTFAKIQLKAGINRDTTSYTNTGGWFDSNFIRFRNGLPEKIGGWTKVYANQSNLIGTCRKLYDWSSLIGTQFLAMPTNVKFYVDTNGAINDITALRRDVVLPNNPFTTTNTSATIIVTDVNHGVTINDYITISGAATTNGILDTQINGQYLVSNVINANAYAVTTAGTATSSGAGGGTTVRVKYQFHPGVTTEAVFAGWGSGPWGGVSGSYGWGSGPATTITTYSSGLWSVDNYGEDMIACPRDMVIATQLGTTPITAANASNVITVTQVNHGYSNGTAVIIGGVNETVGGISATYINGSHPITVANANAYTYTVPVTATSNQSAGTSAYAYLSSIIYWDVTYTDQPATSLSLLSNTYAKSYMPYVAKEVMVSDQNRQVIAFGCNPFDTTKTQDPMVVRWSDSNDPTNWDASDTTKTAGERRLSAGSFIVTAAQNREEILVWTDGSLFSMTYVGPPDGYSFNLVGTNFDIIGPNAKTIVGSAAYWMGSNNFYTYNGRVEPMPCTVRDYVFLDISRDDGNKVYCSSDTGNNEIIWFYPSYSQGTDPEFSGVWENDRYVVYNYAEDAWYYGTLSRSAWIDRRGHPYPRATDLNGILYNHEYGFDDGSTTPATAINAYIQSSPIEIQDGENYMFIKRVIPDLTFRNSIPTGATEPVVKFTIKPQDYPGAETFSGQERDVQRDAAATVNVNRFTNQVFTRLRTRSVALRVESEDTNISWRLGTPRLDMRQDGKK